MRLYLAPDRLTVVGALAYQRLQQARSSRLVEHGRPESWELHAIGAKGEIAFAELTGLDMTGDDLTKPDFPGYEIKTRNRRNADLFIKPHMADRQPPSTVYVLAYTQLGSSFVDFVGWITLGDFLEHPNSEVRDVQGRVLMLPWHHLNPMRSLPCLTRC
jgi:hypothetical protein